MHQTAERRAVAEKTYTAKAFAASGAKSGLAPDPSRDALRVLKTCKSKLCIAAFATPISIRFATNGTP